MEGAQVDRFVFSEFLLDMDTFDDNLENIVSRYCS